MNGIMIIFLPMAISALIIAIFTFIAKPYSSWDVAVILFSLISLAISFTMFIIMKFSKKYKKTKDINDY